MEIAIDYPLVSTEYNTQSRVETPFINHHVVEVVGQKPRFHLDSRTVRNLLKAYRADILYSKFSTAEGGRFSTCCGKAKVLEERL